MVEYETLSKISRDIFASILSRGEGQGTGQYHIHMYNGQVTRT